jgi:hypothetical protein
MSVSFFIVVRRDFCKDRIISILLLHILKAYSSEGLSSCRLWKDIKPVAM